MLRHINLIAFGICAVHAGFAEAQDNIDRYKSSLTTNQVSVMTLKKNGILYGCSVAEYIKGHHLTVTKTPGKDAAVEIESVTNEDKSNAKVKIGSVDKDLFILRENGNIDLYLDAKAAASAAHLGLSIGDIILSPAIMSDINKTADQCMLMQ